MRVVIAEDLALLRDGLERLLTDAGIDVVGAVGDAAALMTHVAASTPDLVIADVRLPPSYRDEGIRAAIELRARQPELGILVLSQYVERTYAAELLADGRGGIGYLLKDRVVDVGDFVEAVRRVGAGGTALDPQVVSALVASRRAPQSLSLLTPREREVLALMAEGRTNTGIASRLTITLGAVEKHIANIFSKLGLTPTTTEHRRVRAVLMWLQQHGTSDLI